MWDLNLGEWTQEAIQRLPFSLDWRVSDPGFCKARLDYWSWWQTLRIDCYCQLPSCDASPLRQSILARSGRILDGLFLTIATEETKNITKARTLIVALLLSISLQRWLNYQHGLNVGLIGLPFPLIREATSTFLRKNSFFNRISWTIILAHEGGEAKF